MTKIFVTILFFSFSIHTMEPKDKIKYLSIKKLAQSFGTKVAFAFHEFAQNDKSRLFFINNIIFQIFPTDIQKLLAKHIIQKEQTQLYKQHWLQPLTYVKDTPIQEKDALAYDQHTHMFVSIDDEYTINLFTQDPTDSDDAEPSYMCNYSGIIMKKYNNAKHIQTIPNITRKKIHACCFLNTDTTQGDITLATLSKNQLDLWNCSTNTHQHTYILTKPYCLFKKNNNTVVIGKENQATITEFNFEQQSEKTIFYDNYYNDRNSTYSLLPLSHNTFISGHNYGRILKHNSEEIIEGNSSEICATSLIYIPEARLIVSGGPNGDIVFSDEKTLEPWGTEEPIAPSHTGDQLVIGLYHEDNKLLIMRDDNNAEVYEAYDEKTKSVLTTLSTDLTIHQALLLAESVIPANINSIPFKCNEYNYALFKSLKEHKPNVYYFFKDDIKKQIKRRAETELEQDITKKIRR